MSIKKIAVIGSGVMGKGIVTHLVNCGMPVIFLDIVPDLASDRNILTLKAIEEFSGPKSLLINKADISLVTIGNLEDNAKLLSKADLIIEVVIEKLEIKRQIYNLIAKYRKKNSVISSNTSTIPLKNLIEGFDLDFCKDFMITHFFNPPRHMKLVELVTHENNSISQISRVKKFFDEKLGKKIVDCKDTPGFIANRIGCYWLETGLATAVRFNIKVAEADAAMTVFGIPKTGIFGLFDLIGIDLMPLIAKSMIELLPSNDSFVQEYRLNEVLDYMIQNKMLGRKVKQGFYKILQNEDGQKVTQALDYQKREYYNSVIDKEILQMDMNSLFDSKSDLSNFAVITILKTLRYAANLIPEISDNIINIDNAIKLGYNWKFGPFELIDIIGVEKFKNLLTLYDLEIPQIIKFVKENKFYKAKKYFNYIQNTQNFDHYKNIPKIKSAIILSDLPKRRILLENQDAVLLDISDGVACFSLKNKSSVASVTSLLLLEESLNFITGNNNFNAMIIGHGGRNFCVGADLKYILECIKEKKFIDLDNYLKLGQDVMYEIKFAKFPIIAAHNGLALGGGCELLLHSHGVVSHLEANAGLVESSIGLIPSWGGTKEMIVRSYLDENKLKKSFQNILFGKKTSSVADLVSNFYFQNHSYYASEERILKYAKNVALKMSNSFVQKENQTYQIKSKLIYDLLSEYLDSMTELSDEQFFIGQVLLDIFSASSRNEILNVSEITMLDIERDNFLTLANKKYAIEKIQNIIRPT